MPEGDSVYLVARKLEAALDGRRLSRGELRGGRAAGARLDGMTVLGHDTHGKHLLTRLDSGMTVHTHLRMQGSWTVVRPGRRLPAALADGIRVLFAVEDGPTAYGLDVPIVDLVPTDREVDVIGHLGPDPLRVDWDPAEAARRMSARAGTPLVTVLLDQRCLAGVGNLWANELCFLRGLYPWTDVADVDLPPLLALARRTLRASATLPGMYQVTTGTRQHGSNHWVAGRAGRPCLRCGTTVRVRDAVQSATGIDAERRTWWCPHCQPEPRGA